MSTSSKGTWQKLFAGHRHGHEANEVQIAGPSSGGGNSTSAIRAYLRLRPASEALQAKGVPQSANVEVLSKNEVAAAPAALPSFDTSTHSLVSSATRSSLSGRSSNNNDAEVYTFTEVLSEDTNQSDLYNVTARPLAANALGVGSSKCMSDSLILAYGVSGGGKTYTVQGSHSEPGLLPRTLSTILRSVANKQSQAWIRPARLTGIEAVPAAERYVDPRWRQNRTSGASSSDEVIDLPDQYEYAVWGSFVEVYNENIHDLLSNETKPKNLSLKQDHKNSDNKFIAGAMTVRLWSEQHAIEVLEKGLLTRHRSATRQNETSSRSHSIFTIQVLRFPRGADAISPSTAVHMSRLSVVDLAGSERARNTQTHGDRLKEAGKINQSLMVLGRCFEMIRANDVAVARGKVPAPVPFRHSKLTEVLKPFFCGNGEIVMVAAMDAYRTALDENMNVLRFSSLARQIKTNYHIPPSPSMLTPQNEVPHYQLPTRSLRSRGVPPIPTRPSERARHASGSSQPEIEIVETEETAAIADTSLASFIEDGDALDEEDNDELDEPEDDDEDSLVNSLFEEIRQLRQEAVQKDIEHELAIQRVRQEERKRAAGKLEEQRLQMEADAQDQRAILEELMNRKIDNMQTSYNNMVHDYQQQLKLALAARAEAEEDDEDSVQLRAAESDIEESFEEFINQSASHSRSPLAPASLSRVRQDNASSTVDITARTENDSFQSEVDDSAADFIAEASKSTGKKRVLRPNKIYNEGF